MRDPGIRPTNAEMAQRVLLLGSAGPIQVYVNDAGQEAYRLTEEGVRVGNMLAMGRGRGGKAVLRRCWREAAPAESGPSPRFWCGPSHERRA